MLQPKWCSGGIRKAMIWSRRCPASCFLTAFWFWSVLSFQVESWLFFFPQKNGVLPKHAQLFFRSSILAISFPGSNLRKFPVGNIIDTNSKSTKNIFGETASEFSFQNSHKVFLLWILCLKLEVTVGWPFFNLSLGLCYCWNTDTISLAMPIQSEYTGTKCGIWTGLNLHTVTECRNTPNIPI